MADAVVGMSNYPVLQDIADLVRANLDDSLAGATNTPGEGQIVVDNPDIAPFLAKHLASSIRELYRKLRNAGDPTLIYDNYILTGCPIINGPLGSGVQDPTVQNSISPVGFFDGTQVWANFALPANCRSVERVEERQSGSNDLFSLVVQPQEGMTNCLQGSFNNQCEVRNDQIWLPGTLVPMDFKIRYLGTCPKILGDNVDYNTTQIPIMDCEEYVAYRCSYKIATMLGSQQAGEFKAEAEAALLDLKNAIVRNKQGITYRRAPFLGGVVGTDYTGRNQ